MSSCPTLVPGAEFVRTTLGYIDCQAQAIGENGYLALAAPGSSVALLLGGVLTIFIALFGYRLILGETPGLRDGVVAAVKVGIVLMLATSWAAYRVLVYDVVVHAPATLAAEVGGATGVPGAGGGLVDWLQSVDDSFVQLEIIGVGQAALVSQTPPIVPPGVGNSTATAAAPLPQLQQQSDPARDAQLIRQARSVYLVGMIGALASLRLIAGLLLALGPLFALFLFFDTTRGLFEGWVRGLVGVLIGATATALVLRVELALLSPWLVEILAARSAGLATPSVPVELFVVTFGFALTLLAALIASAGVARGFRIPHVLRLTASSFRFLRAEANATAERSSNRRDRQREPQREPLSPDASRSRALVIADAAQASALREASLLQQRTISIGASQAGSPTAARTNVVGSLVTPIGRSFNRRMTSRVSAGANRRDRAI